MNPFLATARGKPASRRPLWIMRQAGRYLPEYRAMKARHSFLEMCGNPKLACEVTMQPLRRFDLDAAILFTDLLIPVAAMGVGLTYEPGPVLDRQIKTMADVAALRTPDPQETLQPMLESARMVREELADDKALIGFVGAPFTLACYMIEGRGSKAWDGTRRLMFEAPDVFEALLQRLADALEPLVVALRESGCDAIQVFDSWGSVLGADDYERVCAPRTEQLLRCAQGAGAVAINYVNGAAQHLPVMAKGRGDVLAFDWRLPIARAREIAGDDRTLQGNLDPTILFGSEDMLRQRVREVCEHAGPRHIFNLGHGIQPDTAPEAVAIIVDEVHRS